MLLCFLSLFLASLSSQLSIIEMRLFTSKKPVMKQQHIHQEVLVFTTTSLSRKVLYENNNDKNENMSLAEKLEQACWDGLLNEMFPEIIGSGSTPSPKMFIWGIYSGKSYLAIDLVDTPDVIDPVRSVDPYLFLPELNSN